MNTNIIINLAVTLVACGSVYYLLRKRINNVDNKVSVLMQLVKEHHAQAQQQAAIIMRESHDNHSQNLHQGHANMEMEQGESLITVSDDEERNGDDNYDSDEDEGDSDDSEEVSDNDDDGNERKVIQFISDITGEDNSMQGQVNAFFSPINLVGSLESFQGNEPESLEISEIKEDDNLEKNIENVVANNDDNSKKNVVNDNVNTNNESEETENKNSSSNEEDNSASLGEMTLDDIQLNDDTSMEKQNNNDSENKTDEEQEVKITLEELKKFKLAELKSTAEEMGLEGFKKSKKTRFI